MAGLPDPRLDHHGKTSRHLTSLYHEVQTYESMPNRRDPVSLAMLRHMITSRGEDTDSIAFALTDFQILSHYAGLRLGEYAQVSAEKVTMTKDKRLPKAFILSDFTFYGPNQRRLPQPPDTHLPLDSVFSAKLRFREQKNGNNGEEILFTANTGDMPLCPVRAMLRIRERAIRLQVAPSSPIAVGMSANRCIRLHESLVNRHIQQAAAAVYNITSQSDLQRYSSHSARVGAAVHLHLAGKDASFIKTRLRWRSDTFLLYLRNVAGLAAQHTDAVNTVPFS